MILIIFFFLILEQGYLFWPFLPLPPREGEILSKLKNREEFEGGLKNPEEFELAGQNI